jgi:phosphoglycerate dehydrogenase-like enzyme
MSLTIWTNGKFSEEATRLLVDGVGSHRLVVSAHSTAWVQAAGEADPELAGADIAFGQPDADQCIAADRLRWVEVTTAGYTRYDREDFRTRLLARGATFTNASDVFADSCAQHALGMMLALGRLLLPSYQDQLTARSWPYLRWRYDARLLTGSTIVLLGFGAIGRRLAELLAPFAPELHAVRRQAIDDPRVRRVADGDLPAVLGRADHVVNLLPANDATRHYVDAALLAKFKPGARFYNVGRGATVDQDALLAALASGRLDAAYLDVTEVEPLPPDHPLWTTPRCYITPHIAGGRADQDEALVRHFLGNLKAFESGKPMVDKVF